MDQDTEAEAYLPDELIVEILARLLAKSLCQFKCVSRRWCRLISDPAHRVRLAQTLSGFFYWSRDPAWRFTVLPSSVTHLGLAGEDDLPLVDIALSFLPSSYGEVEIMASCNGLLLLLCSNDELSCSVPPPFYVVCNPATREWVALPQPKHTPGQSTPMVVVEVDNLNTNYLEAVEIYSSETGTWDLRETKWLSFLGHITYFNGFLHLPIEYSAVASVGTKGQPWRVTKVQCEDHRQDYGRGYVGHSQGRLFYASNVRKDDVQSIYVLDQDQDSEEFTLKHNVKKSDLLLEPWSRFMKPTYYIAGFHPHGDLIFFYDRSRLTRKADFL